MEDEVEGGKEKKEEEENGKEEKRKNVEEVYRDEKRGRGGVGRE